MAKRTESDFTPTMLAFLVWCFRTLNPKFTEPLLVGRSVEEAAQVVFGDITARVRGNRALKGKLTAADYRAIMDRIASLHLRTRQGAESVLETAVSHVGGPHDHEPASQLPL